jgi:hypothetical protein
MTYRVRTIEVFERQTEKLVRKYPSLKEELLALIRVLKQNPFEGTPLGKNCYKIRLAIKSKGRGKSGGARIITNIVVSETTVFLICIYDKSTKENLSDKELDALLKDIPE